MNKKEINGYNKWLSEVWSPNHVNIPFINQVADAYLGHLKKEKKFEKFGCLAVKEVRVRCIECRKEEFLQMTQTDSWRETRTMGYEVMNSFEGESICECGNKMIIALDLFEYPKGFKNYIDIQNEGCLNMDNVDEIKVEKND